jgi:hypothetical protein
MSALCPRCSAPLLTSEAKWLPGADGYLPALQWEHQRPDGAGKCRCHTGPPARYEMVPDCATVGAESDTLASVPAAPGSAA